MTTPCRPPRLRRYQEVAAYCQQTFEEHGYTPSYSMIRDRFGIEDFGTVRRYVHQAADAGLIELGEYKGGRGPRRGQRIRLGRPEEADGKRIKMGREL